MNAININRGVNDMGHDETNEDVEDMYCGDDVQPLNAENIHDWASLLRNREIERFNDAIAGSGRDYRAFITRNDLSALDLRGAHLAGAFLSGTDFSGSDLRGIDFTDATLIEANLTNADLREATGLTWEQLARTIGLESAKLPDYLRCTDGRTRVE